MLELTEKEMLEKLKDFDMLIDHQCLGHYNGIAPLLVFMNLGAEQTSPRISQFIAYTPNWGRMMAYAVTVVYSLPERNFKRLSMVDFGGLFRKTKKPTVIVIKQDFPPDILAKVGLSGGNMNPEEGYLKHAELLEL